MGGTQQIISNNPGRQAEYQVQNGLSTENEGVEGSVNLKQGVQKVILRPGSGGAGL